MCFSLALIMYLATATETEHKMERAFLLDIVIRKGLAILQLLACKDESLLVRRNALLVLNLLLYIFNGIRRLCIKRNGLASERFDEDLHSTTESEHKVEGAFLLDIVIGKRASIFKLLARKDETLLVRRNALLVLNLLLHVLNRVSGFSIECNGLASKSLHKDLHDIC